MSDLMNRLNATPVVPLIAATDAKTGVETARALVEGGLTVLEIVLRTPASMDALQAICEQVPEAISGAGTVLTAEQAQETVERGAKFIVSPGLTEGVVKTAQKNDVPILAGVATATELQQAYNYDLRTVKFFPAGLAGGPKMLKAFSSVFKGVKFMPTGGVSAANLGDYLANPAVLACGGSWLTPADAIASGDYAAVTKLAREAVEIAKAARA